MFTYGWQIKRWPAGWLECWQLGPLQSKHSAVGVCAFERPHLCFLYAVLGQCTCHDSVSCKHWPGAQAFPVLRRDNEFVSQHFDVNDQPVDSDNVLFWNVSYTQPDCVFVKNTGFSEAAVKAVIRHRVVLWSQDYHITPLMDIKSLLGPIGVKVVDQSLSYQCSKVRKCTSCSANGNVQLLFIHQDEGICFVKSLHWQFFKVSQCHSLQQICRQTRNLS